MKIAKQKKAKSKSNNTQIGIIGEYSVAAELSKRGFTASLTLKNAEAVDILVVAENTHKLLGIQVKTRTFNKDKWVLNEKNENLYAENLYYVFVKLDKEQNPYEYHIVPSEVVAKIVKEKYDQWIKKTGKKPGKGMRFFKDEYIENKYLNNWDLLKG